MHNSPTLRLPNFVIGGAPRCGTTWLYRALERHPALWMAKPLRPEPKFFLVDDEYRRGLGSYSKRWFAAAPPSAITGEKSTNYLESSVAAARMARDLPDVRVIFLLREPASRALSNYLWSRMSGLEDKAFGVALKHEARRTREYRGRFVYSRPFAYYERGLYARHLRTWLGLFPAEHLFIGTYEELIAHPETFIAKVHVFIGVPPRPEDANGVGVVNATDECLEDYEPEIAGLRARYRCPNLELESLLGCRLWDTA